MTDRQSPDSVSSIQSSARTIIAPMEVDEFVASFLNLV